MTHNNIIVKESLIWEKGGLFDKLIEIQNEFVSMIKSDIKKDDAFDVKIQNLAIQEKQLKAEIKRIQQLEATI